MHLTSPLKLLFLARAARNKGLPDSLAALARVNSLSWSLTVAGGVHPAEAILVGRLLADLPSVAINMVGQVSHGNVPELMNGCDVVLVPSRYENFCNVALEALAAGKAIIGSRCGGIPDLVLHEWNGLLFEPGDIDGMVAAMRRLIYDRDLVRRFGQRGRTRAARYDWRSVTAATEDILRKAAC